MHEWFKESIYDHACPGCRSERPSVVVPSTVEKVFHYARCHASACLHKLKQRAASRCGSEQRYFRDLLGASNRGDSCKTYELLSEWLECFNPQKSLETYQCLWEDRCLKLEIERLVSAVYGPDAIFSWDGRALATLLKRRRRAILAAHPKTRCFSESAAFVTDRTCYGETTTVNPQGSIQEGHDAIALRQRSSGQRS